MIISAVIIAVALLLGIAGLLLPRKEKPAETGPVVAPFPASQQDQSPTSGLEVQNSEPQQAAPSLPVSLDKRPLPDTPEITPTIRDWRGLRLAAVVDVETTGLSNADEVIEIAIALIAFHPDTHVIAGITDSYFGRREPSVPMNPFARRVHGISSRDLAGHQIDTEKAIRLLCSAEFVIAHNAPFDHRFMAGLLPECAGMNWRCTMSSIDWETLGSKKLHDISKALGGPTGKHHRASVDVATVISVLAQNNSQGALYLTELLEVYEPKPTRARKKSRAAGAE